MAKPKATASTSDIASHGLKATTAAPRAPSAVPTEPKGSNLLISGTTWWQRASEVELNLPNASPGHAAGIAAVQAIQHDRSVNECTVVNKVVADSEELGGVRVFGQDFVSTTTAGSVATTALGNITQSAAGNVHIEASDTISFKVGSTGITITEAGVHISQGDLAAGGAGASISVSRTSVSMYATSVQARALTELSLQAMGSSLRLSPLEASLTALAKAQCTAGWYTYAGTLNLLTPSTTGVASMCLPVDEDASPDVDTMDASDATLAAVGAQYAFASTAPWRLRRALPTVQPDTTWLSLLSALGQALAPGTLAAKLTETSLEAKASGFIAKGNEAAMLGGYYMPQFFDSSLQACPTEPLTPSAADQLATHQQPLPVVQSPGTGRCLVLSGGGTESKAELFGARAAASLAMMNAKAVSRYAQLHAFSSAAVELWTAGAASIALVQHYATHRSDSEGNMTATNMHNMSLAPKHTTDTVELEQLTQAIGLAVHEASQVATS
jgi:hypothetical protein